MATLLEINDALSYLTAAYPTQTISEATMVVYEDMLLDLDAAAIWLAIRDYTSAGHTGLPWGPAMLRGMALKRQATGSVVITGKDREWLEGKALEYGFLLTNVMVIGDGKPWMLEDGQPGIDTLLGNGSAETKKIGPLQNEWQAILETFSHCKPLERAEVIEWDGETAVVQVLNKDVQAYLELRLQNRIEWALRTILEKEIFVRFVSAEMEGVKS